VDWRTVVVALTSCLAFLGLVARWDEPWELVVLALFIGPLIVLLATDLDQRLLPDLLTVPLAFYAAAVSVPSVVGIDLNPLLAGKSLGFASAIAAAVLAPLLLAVSDRVFRGALGGGDLKLAISLGLMCGVTLLLAGFLVASIVFAAVLVVLLVTRRLTLRTAVPFGPVLVGAGIVATLLPG
jgi:leader peptidase (prepilin peptidase)/N-methyltransferase